MGGKKKNEEKKVENASEFEVKGAEALLNYLKSNKNKINAALASRLPSLIDRIPSGVFAVDYATGGGVPVGKVSVLWGEWGSTKTTLALRFAANALKMGKAGAVLWLDVEGSFNQSWAKQLGLDTDQVVVVVPSSAEEALNVIIEVGKEKVADFIVLDSIASLSPVVEKEKLVGEWQQGLLARLLGQFSRKYVCDVMAAGEKVPTLLLINQVRERIVMFGNPLTRPGGKAIGFLSSLEIRLKEAKPVEKDGQILMVEVGGVVNKNRFYKTGVEFSYRMAVAAFDRYVPGDVVEEDMVISQAKDVGFIRKEKGQYVFDGVEVEEGVEFPTLESIKDYFLANKEKFWYFKQKLLEYLLYGNEGN
jgi:recombination protein RecA